MSYFIEDQVTNAYNARCIGRQTQLMQATMDFIEYFVNLGDDRATAESKVTQLSTETATYLYAYVLGNKQPLIDEINASSLPFMDAAAKQELVSHLTA